MDRCLNFQAQMLDLVYDLLEVDERETLRAHLEVCVDCQAALREAQTQQQLLAVAARLEFPGVVFSTPEPVTVEVEPEPVPEPVVLPLARPRRRPLAWRSCAHAA